MRASNDEKGFKSIFESLENKLTDLPPRPGTSSGKRPTTASGSRMHVSNFESISHQSPPVQANSNLILQKEIQKDSLLKILTERQANTSNDINVLAESGDASGISALMQSGCDITVCRGMDGYTPLHYASNRGHVAVVSTLLNSNLPVNIKNDYGEAPLHLAVYSGNILVVEQLLDHGADIDSINDYGETPLFYAARRCFPAIVRLLLQRGADSKIQDKVGDYACDHTEDAHTMRALESRSIEQGRSLPVKVLLEVFSYMNAKEICRCACVSGKWHRVSESESLWQRLGVRRWELALQSSLGFSSTPAASFTFRRPSKENISLQQKPRSRPPSK